MRWAATRAAGTALGDEAGSSVCLSIGRRSRPIDKGEQLELTGREVHIIWSLGGGKSPALIKIER